LHIAAHSNASRYHFGLHDFLLFEAMLSRRQLIIAGSAAAAAPLFTPAYALLPNVPLAQFSTQTPDYTGPNVLHGWLGVALEIMRSGWLPPPPVTSRAFAMMFTAMYDAWAPYDATALPNFTGGSTRTSGDTTAAQNKAVSYAAYTVLLDLYGNDPLQVHRLTTHMKSLGYHAGATFPSNDPGQFGRDAAMRVLSFRWFDGSNQKGDITAGAYADYTNYKPVNSITSVQDATRWQPLEFDDGKKLPFLTPHWGRVKPFALTSGDEFRPTITLPTFGSKEYRDQTEEVLTVTAALNDEQKATVEYWAASKLTITPPGVWLRIAQVMSQRAKHTLAQDIRLFFTLSNALMDAGIACWDCKAHYDSVRPITAVRTLYPDKQIAGLVSTEKGIGLMRGNRWRPYQPGWFITPPFAEYVSGHACFSAAGAEVLARFTGSDNYGGNITIASGSLTYQSNMPKQNIQLNWNTFTDAANQAAMSRLYGGIHFRAGNDAGLALGRKVAERVWVKANRLISGSV
jgi:hypothetical protein